MLRKRVSLRNAVLEIDFRNVRLVEQTSSYKFLISDECVNVHELIHAISRGARDSNVKGLVLNLGVVHASIVVLQELRRAIENFRATCKPTILYANTIGEFSNSVILYWFASVFEFIYISPGGYVNFLGWRHSTFFLRNAIQKLGINVYLETRRKYKTFANIFTQDSYTEEHRESEQHITEEVLSQFLSDIAGSRGFSIERARELLQNGPYPASLAKSDNLITDIVYETDFYEVVIKRHFGRKSFFNLFESYHLVFWDHYFKPEFSCNIFSPKVALVHLQGNIHIGESQKHWDGNISSIGSRSVIQMIDKIIESNSFKAIILRINSGGGSATASDLICNALDRARKEGIIVVTSMSQLAASGGYYIAAPSNKILAESLTLTGSIGVMAGKMDFTKMVNNLSITFEQIKTADGDKFYDQFSDMDEHCKRKLDLVLDSVYDQFKSVVCRGRNMSSEKVEELAQGRVWMGSDAVRSGLVDEIGGLGEAVETVKKMLNASSLRISVYPRPPSLWQLLGEKKANNSRKKNVFYNSTWLSYFVSYSVNGFSWILANCIGKDNLSFVASVMKSLFNGVGNLAPLLEVDSTGIVLPPSAISQYNDAVLCV